MKDRDTGDPEPRGVQGKPRTMLGSGRARWRIYVLPLDLCLSSSQTPTIIRMTGHQWAVSERRGGSQPRLDRRKMIPNPMRMYAPILEYLGTGSYVLIRHNNWIKSIFLASLFLSHVKNRPRVLTLQRFLDLRRSSAPVASAPASLCSVPFRLRRLRKPCFHFQKTALLQWREWAREYCRVPPAMCHAITVASLHDSNGNCCPCQRGPGTIS